MSYTNATNKSRNKLKEAMVELLKDYTFEKVTIQMIVEKSNLTRSSFYRYYEDKYFLITEIEDEIIDYFVKNSINGRLSIHSFERDGSQHLIKIFRGLADYRTIINRLLSNNGDPNFERRLQAEISGIYFKNSVFPVEKNEKTLLVNNYICNFFINTLKYWSSADRIITEEELANLVHDIYISGFIKPLSCVNQ